MLYIPYVNMRKIPVLRTLKSLLTHLKDSGNVGKNVF